MRRQQREQVGRTRHVVGFHHGVMEPDNMARASELLALLATHANVRPRKMSELCP